MLSDKYWLSGPTLPGRPSPPSRGEKVEKGQGKSEPLPRFAFVLILGWLAWKYLPLLARTIAVHFDYDAGWLHDPWLLPGLTVGGGAALGWMLGEPLNYVLGWSFQMFNICLLYTSPSPRDRTRSRMPSSA